MTDEAKSVPGDGLRDDEMVQYADPKTGKVKLVTYAEWRRLTGHENA